jgi:hypothetical protein
MASDGNRRRAFLGLTREALEDRQLLSAVIPAGRIAEVQGLDRSPPLLKAPSLFIEPQAGRVRSSGQSTRRDPISDWGSATSAIPRLATRWPPPRAGSR